jgi:Family of unknown function (DUF5677)
MPIEISVSWKLEVEDDQADLLQILQALIEAGEAAFTKIKAVGYFRQALALLLGQAVASAQALHVLCMAGRANQARPTVRAILENVINSFYIARDPERRAERFWPYRPIPHLKVAEARSRFFGISTELDAIRAQAEGARRLLGSERWADRNVRARAEECGLAALWELYYTEASAFSHGDASTWNAFTLDDCSRLQLGPVRYGHDPWFTLSWDSITFPCSVTSRLYVAPIICQARSKRSLCAKSRSVKIACPPACRQRIADDPSARARLERRRGSREQLHQTYIQQLCKQYGVDFVIAGYNHYYSRAVVDGVNHIANGGGGAPLYTPPQSGQPNVLPSVAPRAPRSFSYIRVRHPWRQARHDRSPPHRDVIETVTVTHTPPGNQPHVANAGPDQTVVDANGDGHESVLLDGSASTDPDGTPGTLRFRVARIQLGSERRSPQDRSSRPAARPTIFRLAADCSASAHVILVVSGAVERAWCAVYGLPFREEARVSRRL